MIVVTGHAASVVGGGESAPSASEYLRHQKSLKYMGVQDRLAVHCTGRALAMANLRSEHLGAKAGLYLAVGYIPFTREDIDPVLEASIEGGEFSEARFGREGYQRAHPLLTFRCLPNIPAYHVSANFDVQGPYFVSYPGPGQLYQALEEAVHALDSGQVEVALVGGVAHQRNFLVEHHFERLCPPVPSECLFDSGAVVVLERQPDAVRRGGVARASLLDLSLEYRPFSALERWPEASCSPAWGPAALFVELDRAIAERRPELSHRLECRDGLTVQSRWSLAP